MIRINYELIVENASSFFLFIVRQLTRPNSWTSSFYPHPRISRTFFSINIPRTAAAYVENIKSIIVVTKISKYFMRFVSCLKLPNGGRYGFRKRSQDFKRIIGIVGNVVETFPKCAQRSLKQNRGFSVFGKLSAGFENKRSCAFPISKSVILTT